MKEGTDYRGWIFLGLWLLFLFIGLYGIKTIYNGIESNDIERIQNGIGMSLGLVGTFNISDMWRMSEIDALKKEVEKLKQSQGVEA